jgi:hypothetical protein
MLFVCDLVVPGGRQQIGHSLMEKATLIVVRGGVESTQRTRYTSSSHAMQCISQIAAIYRQYFFIDFTFIQQTQ